MVGGAGWPWAGRMEAGLSSLDVARRGIWQVKWIRGLGLRGERQVLRSLPPANTRVGGSPLASLSSLSACTCLASGLWVLIARHHPPCFRPCQSVRVTFGRKSSPLAEAARMSGGLSGHSSRPWWPSPLEGMDGAAKSRIMSGVSLLPRRNERKARPVRAFPFPGWFGRCFVRLPEGMDEGAGDCG